MENNSEIVGSCLLSEQISIDAVPTVFQLHETYIFIALDNGEIQKFNIDGIGKRSLSASQNAVWSLAMSGDVLASGGVNGEVEIWSLATGWVKIARFFPFLCHL
jgi:WD40 repeat protein